MDQFEGKVAVITGSASGIGRALAERCLAEGMHVVMADIEEAALEKTAAEFKQAGHNDVLTVQTDVAQLEALEHLKARAIDTFGAVHLLFNNAGVGGAGNAWRGSVNDWTWTIGVNLYSVIHGLRVFVPQMLDQGDACHIVNTASVAGLLGGVTNAPYSVTKHGVVALTEQLYRDLGNEGADQIGCSVLGPGLINTNIMSSDRNRPDTLMDAPIALTPEQEAGRAMFQAMLEEGMAPSQVADIVFQAIRNRQLYILTHTDFNERILERASEITTGTNPAIGGII